jgi:hypothetical protein
MTPEDEGRVRAAHLAAYAKAPHTDLVEHLRAVHHRPRGDFPMSRTTVKAAHAAVHEPQPEAATPPPPGAVPPPRAVSRAARAAARQVTSQISPITAWIAYATEAGFNPADPDEGETYVAFRRTYLDAIRAGLEDCA